MKDAPVDEPTHEHDEMVEADGTVASEDNEQPDMAEVEPQTGHHPDNDGETVEEDE